MGEVIRLAERRQARRPRPGDQRIAPARAEFFFDLACPFTYLAAERVERAFDHVVWTPASATIVRGGALESDPGAIERVQAAAAERAQALRLPLEWPETFPAEVPAAMRVAAHAAANGRGAEFVLAAGRLAFCGGFDLDHPEIPAEAAAAAGIGLDHCLAGAGDVALVRVIHANARRLFPAGADRLPALRVARTLVWGESRVS